MLLIKLARANEIYRNCFKSKLKHEIMLQHFSSDDSKEKKILSLYKKKDPLVEKKRRGNKKAFGLFQEKEIKRNGKIETEEIKELKTKDVSAKLLEILKSAEYVPEDFISTQNIQATKKKKAPKSSETSKVNIVDTVKQVAVTLGGEFDATEEELLKAFKSLVHSSAEPKSYGEYNKIRKEAMMSSLSLQGGDLHIFQTDMQEDHRRPILETWNHLEAVTLTSLKQHPARNYFEELINWTYQGKLWHFPIDNEQDWEEEKATDFTDHIFLDKHLEGWCPRTGPIRHFMELVTVGLSKNPYISAEKKREHIMWFKDYFQSKNALLNELGISSEQTKSNVELLESEAIKK